MLLLVLPHASLAEATIIIGASAAGCALLADSFVRVLPLFPLRPASCNPVHRPLLFFNLWKSASSADQEIHPQITQIYADEGIGRSPCKVVWPPALDR